MVVWETGSAVREFLHIDDLADAAIFLMQQYLVKLSILESDISIRELAYMVGAVGYHGSILQETSKPDGTPLKLSDVPRLTVLGSKRRIELRKGIERIYRYAERQRRAVRLVS